MQEGPQSNPEIQQRSIFEALNQYYLLFFGLACIVSSVFVQEIFILVDQFRLGITFAPIVGIVLPIFILTRRFQKTFVEQLRIRKMRVTTTVQVVAATLVMVVVVDHIYVISQQFMPTSDVYLESLKALKPTGLWSAALTFLGLCIVVPFAEEVVFRGLTQRVFALNMRPILAVTLSGIFFGVIHLSPQLLLSMTCFGIFVAFVFYATSNLTYPIVAHAVLNTIAFVQLTFQSEDSFTDAPFYAQEWWYLPLAIGIVLILSREIKRGAARNAPAPLETKSLDDRE